MADNTLSLYRDAILEHARNPRNAVPVADPQRRARASNPLCGDELELTLALDGATEAEPERIRAIGIQVRGCAVAQASASLMSEAVQGRSLAEATRLGEAFRQVMSGERADLPPALESLRPLESVRQHRSRIACTLLPWTALRSAADDPGEKAKA